MSDMAADFGASLDPEASSGLDGFDTIAAPEYQLGELANDLDALDGAGYDTRDAGRRLADSEMASFLDASQSEVSEAGHEFRGDAQGEFGMPEYRGLT